MSNASQVGKCGSNTQVPILGFSHFSVPADPIMLLKMRCPGLTPRDSDSVGLWGLSICTASKFPDGADGPWAPC